MNNQFSLKMNKRKLIQTLALIGLSLACFSTRAGSLFSFGSAKDEVIPLKIETTAVDPNSPRAPIEIPIYCYYSEGTGCLCFEFDYSMGNVTITVTEESSGVVSMDEYPTSSLFVAVPISGPGIFEVSILLASGTEYTGQFAL